jgi:hypothetical protein
MPPAKRSISPVTMPYLFCPEHGREQEARCLEEQENYRRFGEAVLFVSGPLKSPSHYCQSCNVRLRRGQRGYLVTAFPRLTPEDFGRYDYAAEAEYVVLEHARAMLYGAELPIALPGPATPPPIPPGPAARLA